MKNQPGTMKNHEKPTWNDEKPWKTTFPVLFPFFPLFFAKYFLKNQKYKFFLLARAIHREHFLLHCLKKEIATAKELDLRQLGKVLIFRDRHFSSVTRGHNWPFRCLDFGNLQAVLAETLSHKCISDPYKNL